MIYIFLSILILFLFLQYIFQENDSILESVGVTFLTYLGLSGIIPFLGNEFGGIPYLMSSIEIFIAIIFIVLVWIAVNFKKGIKIYRIPKIKTIEALVLLVAIVVLVRGYLLPMRGWDTFSLYDSRSIMFLSGTKLSEMAPLSKYDEFNQLYYFSYPPMTSVLHALVYSVGSNHVMIVYAMFYVIFMIYTYLFIKDRKLNNIVKFSILIISAFNPLIFQHTKLAYTNLPALTFQFASLFYLIKLSEKYKTPYLILAALFIGFSNWTRSLEPLFISFFIAFLYIIFLKRTTLISKSAKIIGYISLSMFTWAIWHFFIKYTIGGLGKTSPGTGTVLQSVFNSLTLSNLLDVTFFIYHAFFSIGLYILLAFTAILYFAFNYKNRIRIEEKVILVVILVTEAMMIGGTLYFSQTFLWWDQIPDSFLRSNLILVPMIGVLSGYLLEDLQVRK